MLRSDADVEVVGERGANEFLQLRFVKDLSPVLIAKRIRIRAGDRGVVGSAKCGRRRDGRARVFRPHGAAEQEERRDGEHREHDVLFVLRHAP